jgi:hypothetical protein
MAQDGDTITYTYSDGTSVAEDVSAVNEMTIEYIEGVGANNSGGLVESVVVDVSGYDTIYIWVGGGDTGKGRYNGGRIPLGQSGGGSTEVSFVNTDSNDSSDEPFIAGAGGSMATNFLGYNGGGGRGGDADTDGTGVAPPQGGDTSNSADGAVADISEIIDTGSTTANGGSSGDGEVQISYTATSGGSPPSVPTNLSLTTQ